jgi:hypothetical protein
LERQNARTTRPRKQSIAEAEKIIKPSLLREGSSDTKKLCHGIAQVRSEQARRRRPEKSLGEALLLAIDSESSISETTSPAPTVMHIRKNSVSPGVAAESDRKNSQIENWTEMRRRMRFASLFGLAQTAAIPQNAEMQAERMTRALIRSKWG